MVKLPVLKSRQVIKKLQKLGFIEDHTTGSHIIFYHPKTKRRAVIPCHLKDLPPGTLFSILNESGISKEEFTKA